MASVLSDDQGDAIDFAHDRNEIAELEVQLIGAQVGQSILRLHDSARRHWLADPAVLLETSESSLIAAGVSNAYVLALFLRRRANLAQALSVFSTTRALIADLLR